MKKEKLFIGMPCYTTPDDMVSEQLNKAISQARCYEPKWFRKFEGTSLISGTRWQIVTHFINTDADRLLMVDSDMVIITLDVIDRLFEADKPIISAIFVNRRYPVRFVMKPHEKGDLERVERGDIFVKETTGLALTLIKRKAMEGIMRHCQKKNDQNKTLKIQFPNAYFRDEQPFQPMVYNKQYEGEDGSFFIRAKECGYKCWILGGVEIGHLGSYPFTYKDYARVREQEERYEQDKRAGKTPH